MKQLICKECGAEREKGRRLCKPCNSKRCGKYPRYQWDNICLACKKQFKAHRKKQQLCKSCYLLRLKLSKESNCTNNYVFTNKVGRTEHRDIAEKKLNRKLDTNEVIHHMDNNPRNNVDENLIVLSRSLHVKLHSHLSLQRVIKEKSLNENSENCWKALIAPITTAWLEMTSANVIKIWEIG